jgi:hypothetical protein
MSETDWRLWFIHLSGWPVFLAVTATAILFALGLSMMMPSLGNRSVLHNAALVVAALAIGTVIFLGTLVLASRVAFGE